MTEGVGSAAAPLTEDELVCHFDPQHDQATQDLTYATTIAVGLGAVVLVAVPGFRSLSNGNGSIAVALVFVLFAIVLSFVSAFGLYLEKREQSRSTDFLLRIRNGGVDHPNPHGSGATPRPGEPATPMDWVPFLELRLNIWSTWVQVATTFAGLGIVTTLLQTVTPSHITFTAVGPTGFFTIGSIGGAVLTAVIVLPICYRLGRTLRRHRLIQLLIVLVLGRLLRSNEKIAAAYLAAISG